MEISSEVFAELWNTVRDYVSAGKRGELVLSMLEVFADNEVEITDIDEIREIDDDLDDAIQEVFGEDEDELDERY